MLMAHDASSTKRASGMPHRHHSRPTNCGRKYVSTERSSNVVNKIVHRSVYGKELGIFKGLAASRLGRFPWGPDGWGKRMG